MLDIAEGSPKAEFPDSLTLSWADELLDRLESRRVIRRVLLIPPDYTRAHSWGRAADLPVL